MPEERRTTDHAIIEMIREFKLEVREDMKAIKDELKVIDDKIHDTVQSNNKLYFNGFDPHKHVQDHHQVDDIAERAKDNAKSVRSTVEKWIERAAWACITFIAMSTWNTVTENISKVKSFDPPKIEQKVDKYGPPPSNH